jgi:ribosomal protein S18 acetylase RimI-like enzyme
MSCGYSDNDDDPPQVTIRPAEAYDARFLAWAMLTAARSHLQRGWFDIALDRPERECLDFLTRLAVTDARSWWHYSRFHVAEVNGSVAAALCAFHGEDPYVLSQAAMSEAAVGCGWDDTELDAIWARGSYIFTCTFEGVGDVWTIENVATLPQYRKQGLAGELIGHVLRDGKRLGMHEAQITFLIGNDAAAGAYTNVGFEFFGERRSREFEAATGAPGLCRFVRRL